MNWPFVVYFGVASAFGWGAGTVLIFTAKVRPLQLLGFTLCAVGMAGTIPAVVLAMTCQP